MDVIYKRCAGLDVHKKTVVLCVLITQDDGSVHKSIRTFTTMTADLLALAEWLRSLQIEHLAMESTGVSWHPVYNILEESRSILLVNPQHMKAVPGRKTDVKDSEWLAELHRHGLLRASFIPPNPIRELRELSRYRKTLVQERAQEGNRLQKVLEGANIKLAAVATDVLGKSGRRCWRRCQAENKMPRLWLSWHVDACGPSCPSCDWPERGACSRNRPFCSRGFWPTLTAY